MARIIITLPKQLLILIDNFCKEKGYNRSEFIRHAVRSLMGKNV